MTMLKPAGLRPPPTSSPEASRGLRYQPAKALETFALLWAAATLFHLIAYPARVSGWAQCALALLAFGVLLRPRSIGLLAGLAAMQVVELYWNFPRTVSNHWMVTAYINVALLLSLAAVLWRDRRQRSSGGEGLLGGRSAWFETFAPPARVGLLVLYFWAVVHKLNTAFLDPETSCAVDHYSKIAGLLPILPEGALMSYLVIVGTLVIEAGIPVLLCFRRTRALGVLVGLSFHLALSLNPFQRFMDFGSVMIALYFLFVPYDYLGFLREHYGDGRVGRWVQAHAEAIGRWFRRGVYVMAAGIVANYLWEFVGPYGLFDYKYITASLKWGGTLLWFPYVLAALVVAVATFRVMTPARAEPRIRLFRFPARVLALVPALMFLNGVQPYVGLSTENVFSMFSNIHTEYGYTNHLFLPVRYLVTGFQDDMVSVTESSQSRLRTYDKHNRHMTFFEFRDITSRSPDHSVTYERDGQRYVVPRIGDDPLLSQPVPLWQRKLLHFRATVSPEQSVPCTH